MMTIKNNLQRANAARIIFYLLVGVSIISLYSHYLQYNLLSGIQHGVSVTTEAANANDNRQFIIAAINVTLLIVSIVVFLMWVYRAYDNLSKLTNNQMTETPGWAVGYFFVPIVSLYKPYHVLKEIFDRTQTVMLPEEEKHTASKSYIVGLWWTCYILSNIASYAVTFIFSDKSSVSGLIILTSALMYSNFFMLLNKVVTLIMINKIALQEKKLWEFMQAKANEQPSGMIPNLDSMNPPVV